MLVMEADEVGDVELFSWLDLNHKMVKLALHWITVKIGVRRCQASRFHGASLFVKNKTIKLCLFSLSLPL